MLAWFLSHIARLSPLMLPEITVGTHTQHYHHKFQSHHTVWIRESIHHQKLTEFSSERASIPLMISTITLT